jgi:MEMO1 family protein
MRNEPNNSVLYPSVAGRFYPADQDSLSHDVCSYLNNARIEPASEPVMALLSPHAGYVFSGSCAGYAFKYAQNQHPDTVLIVGLSHHGVKDACVFDGDAYHTPLGFIPVDKPLVNDLLCQSPIYADSAPFVTEHSIEVNLPFVQTVFPDAQVVSILITHTDEDLCRRVGHKIADVIQRNPDKSILLVVSSDLSHYPSYDHACQVDQAFLNSLESLDVDTIYRDLHSLSAEPFPNLHCVMCGSAAMMTIVEAANKIGNVQGKTLYYCNSGDSPHGDHDRVVGYGAFAIIRSGSKNESIDHKEEEAPMFSQEDQRELLVLARDSIHAKLCGQAMNRQSSNPAFQIERGLFVTLHNNGELRGCLGRFEGGGLHVDQLVCDLAVQSAQYDSRFAPVTLEELPHIDIQISVLTPLQQVKDVREIIIGRHGLQIKGRTAGGRLASGTLLPQVASERNWDVNTFLESTCTKAGLPPHAWKEQDTQIYKYGAEIFGDLDFAPPPYETIET